MIKIYVSILHFNNSQDTIDCLNSMLALDLEGLAVTTIVLDNGSDKEFSLSLSDYKKINLSLIRSNVNLGFTGGHNYTLKKTIDSEFEYFLLLNNDSILEKKSLLNLVSGFTENSIGAVVPKIYFTKGREFHKDRYTNDQLGKVFWYAGGMIDWNMVSSKHIGVDEVDVGQHDKACNITFATGACLLLRKEVLEKIGLFDDNYFLYYEDADLSVRIIKNNYSIKYIPSAIVWHNNAGSSGSGGELHDYYLTRNKMIFGMKYAPPIIKLHLLKESLRLLFSGRKWQKRGIEDYYKKKFGKGSYVK